MEQPLVSIIMPCYNTANYIADAILSIKAQTYHNIECIIVNDGSTDNTEAIILPLVENDNRFIYIYQENQGVSTARNNGAKIAKGKYLLPFDSDDMLMNNTVKTAVDILEGDASISLVTFNAISFGETGAKPFIPHYVNYQFELEANEIFNTSMMRKIDFDRIGGYNPRLTYTEDWDLWIRLLYKNDNVYHCNQVGYLYRIRNSSTTKSLTTDILNKNLDILHKSNKRIYDEYKR